MTLGLMLMLLGQEAVAGAVAGGQDVREQIACAPISLPAPPAAGMRVSGSAVRGRVMFGPGDAVVINAGTEQGVQNGQKYFVRRQVRDNFTPVGTESPSKSKSRPTQVSIHTAGWVTIVDAQPFISIATVSHACDGILYDDFLEPFTSPVVPQPALGGKPDYANPARIVMGDERRQTASAGQVMLINFGSEQDVRAGQTVTIYRQTMSGLGPVLDVGRATVLTVRPKTSLVRIDSSREAVYIGDLVAIHRVQ